MRLFGLPVLGRLDRWILRSFVLAYVVAAVSLLVLFVVFDMSAKVEELAAGDEGSTGQLARLAWYYLLVLPDLHHQAAPFVSLGAGLYTAARVVGSREWIAVVMAGVPSARLFLPVVVAGAVFASATSLVREEASAAFGHWRAEVSRSLDPESAERDAEDVWLRTRQGSVVFVGRSHLDEEGALEPRLEAVEAPVRMDGGWGILRAAEARYRVGQDDTAGTWHLTDGTLRHLDDAGGLVAAPVETHPALDFEPRDVLLAMRARAEPQSLSGGEAERLLERDRDSAVLRTVVEAHRAAPFMDVLFLLMALPFAIRTTRPALLRGILQAVVLCCTGFVVNYFLRSLGMQGDIDPKLAAWIPVGVIALVGGVLFLRQKT